MGSSGKKKTTMAKLARENRLRERRLNKQAKKDARKQASSDHPDVADAEDPLEAGTAPADADGPLEAGTAPLTPPNSLPVAGQEPATDDREDVDREPSDPREKEVALLRLRDAPDDELAVFGGKLRDDALEAGATELEMRNAQRDHPGHGA